MSDFTGSFWTIFISVFTVLGMVGCLVLLYVSGKTTVLPTEDNTTGHVWDGDLKELNNPLPRWWMWLFILTTLFSFAYLLLYPGLGTFEGTLGWTSAKEHAQEMAQGNQEVAPLYASFKDKNVQELSNNKAATAIGERLFMNNCSQCHGSDARGNKGFPNLTDKDWLHGGEPEVIKETLLKGRIGMMPPMAAAVGGPEDVKNVANYVLSLSGSKHDAQRVAAGQAKFAVCAGCHGADAKGNTAIGAPNLTDKTWLHGAGEAAIINMVNVGVTNQMPAQASKLTPEQIQVLVAYVWGLSNNPSKSLTHQ